MSRSVEGSHVLIRECGLLEHEAERLLRLVTGAARSAMVGGMPVDEERVSRFRGLVARRKAGEPLQYLEGTVQFGPIELEGGPAGAGTPPRDRAALGASDGTASRRTVRCGRHGDRVGLPRPRHQAPASPMSR